MTFYAHDKAAIIRLIDKSLLQVQQQWMDRFDAMRVFVAVATRGSFAEASRQLRLSPSATTRAVAWLEDDLGLSLLTRTTRSLRLTERGAIFLERCRRILDDLDDAERQVRGEDAEPRGEMTVAAPVMFGRLHIMPIVDGLLRNHPALKVRLLLSDRNVHLVEEGVDVAVRIGALADSSLVTTTLGAVSRVLVASPSYLARRGVPASPADLAAHDLIAFEGLATPDEWSFATLDRPLRIEPRLSINSVDAALAAAEVGLGITRALSYQVEAAVRAGRLALVLRTFAPAPTPVSAVYPARRIGSANVAVFTKAAREHFRRNPLDPVEAWGA
jgi:DNA-binding transcriptional LysR family regulator